MEEAGVGEGEEGVRLVRACGSKQLEWIDTETIPLVRLVRACGSKLRIAGLQNQEDLGQARKSLWIETNNTPYNILVAGGSGS